MSEPRNVVAALAQVMEDLPGIARTVHDPPPGARGVTYAYRGINEITGEVQRLFAKYGIVVVPRVKHRMVNDIIVNGNPWSDTYLEVDWAIYGPGGLEDRIDASTFGQGRDNSDKGTNKAMTQAFKYLLLDMLMISDPADDNDGTNTPQDARTAPRTTERVNGEDIPLTPPMETTRTGPPSDLATPKQANYAKALLLGAGLDDDGKLVNWFDVNDLGAWPGSFPNMSKVQASGVIERLKP